MSCNDMGLKMDACKAHADLQLFNRLLFSNFLSIALI